MSYRVASQTACSVVPSLFPRWAGCALVASLSATMAACGAVPESDSEGDFAEAEGEIVGGTVVPGGSAAGLGVVQISHAGVSCTGTILRPGWVLTAGHCYSGDVAYASAPISYVDSTGATQTRYGDAHWVMSAPCGDTLCGEGTLIRLSSPFSIPNPTIPDAPYARNIYPGSHESLVGQTVQCLGYGVNACDGSGAGVLRSGTFEISGLYQWPQPPAQGVNDFLEIEANSAGQLPMSGDSGSTCFLGGYATGVLAQSGCGWLALYSGPRTFHDGVMDRMGALSSPKALYAMSGTTLNGYWHAGQTSLSAQWAQNQVGSGWSFKEVMQDGSVLYAIDSAQKLRYYRHDGQFELSGMWGPRLGVEVGQGWNVLHAIAGGSGIIYTIDAGGAMRWYRHAARNVGKFEVIRTNESEWAAGSGSVIGYGMAGYTHVTTPGNGVFYLRTANGNVYWTRYANHETGGFGGFATPVLLRNIPNVVDLVAKDGGYLYYSTTSGALMEARHVGFETGATTWMGAGGATTSTPYDAQVGSGWAGVHILGSSRPLSN